LKSAVFLLSLACIGAGTLVAGAAAAEEVAEQFRCPTCHTDRLREFKRRRAVTLVGHEPFPETPTGRQHEVSTPAMCFSCHDGFVMDSRKLWIDGHEGHPLGMLPSADVKAPALDGEALFPMNMDGRMYCGSCHSPHEHENAPRDASPFMRVDSSSGNLCQGCHADKAGIAGSGHGPRVSRRRAPPPDYESNGACGRCHSVHDAQAPQMWAREPGVGITVVDSLCNSCHEGDVEASGHPAGVVAWSAELRAELTNDTGEAMPVFGPAGSHAAAGAISCATCHDAHDGQKDRFLRRSESAALLCADCHGEASLYLYLYFHTARARSLPYSADSSLMNSR